MTAERGPLHPQERLGSTIQLDVSDDCYVLFEDKKFVVKAFRLFHRVPSFGFCIQEHDRPGRLKTEVLKELGKNLLHIDFNSIIKFTYVVYMFAFVYLLVLCTVHYSYWSHIVSLRPETRASLRAPQSWRACNAGERACGAA